MLSSSTSTLLHNKEAPNKAASKYDNNNSTAQYCAKMPPSPDPDPNINKLLTSFSQLSISNQESEDGNPSSEKLDQELNQELNKPSSTSCLDAESEDDNSSPEKLNQKLNKPPSTSRSDKLARTELKELCEFIGKQVSGQDEDEGEGEAGEEQMLNNEKYEEHLSHFTKEKRETIQVLLRAAAGDDEEEDELGEGGGKSFFDLTGVELEEGEEEEAKKGKVTGSKDKSGTGQATAPVTAPSTAPAARTRSTSFRTRSTSFGVIRPPKQSLQDWHRSFMDKAKTELAWLEKNYQDMAGFARWDDLWRQYRYQWVLFRHQSYEDTQSWMRTSEMECAEAVTENNWWSVREKWLKASGGKEALEHVLPDREW